MCTGTGTSSWMVREEEGVLDGKRGGGSEINARPAIEAHHMMIMIQCVVQSHAT